MRIIALLVVSIKIQGYLKERGINGAWGGRMGFTEVSAEVYQLNKWLVW